MVSHRHPIATSRGLQREMLLAQLHIYYISAAHIAPSIASNASLGATALLLASLPHFHLKVHYFPISRVAIAQLTCNPSLCNAAAMLCNAASV